MTSDWNDEPPIAQVFDGAGTAVYTTDAEGWLTYYNPAAAALWGYRPEIGRARWCGAWRLLAPDGSDLPLALCPMAVALREGRPVRDAGAVLERPDGTRIPFMPCATPIRARSGAIVAGASILVATRPPLRLDLSEAATVSVRPARRAPGTDLDGLTGALQAVLAALADVEVAHEIECEHLEARIGPGAERERILAQLRAKRERGRSALRRRLGDLQARAAGLTAPAGAQGAAVPGRALLH
ncbi:PAS domain-containing protein [Methylobacterium sp. WSM2598]|uniref:PAS domain-containing protein n=1 Tax=Methylobacterium sp. WSM2598 TaxID=398261 RepID=UPI000378E0A3|nr:PAS domain-containing protein [Methylobacterium sp. WSM2598]